MLEAISMAGLWCCVHRQSADHAGKRPLCAHDVLAAAPTQLPEHPSLLKTRDANRRFALCLGQPIFSI